IIKTNAQRLAAFLNEVALGRPVKIIAHSMGGLIVRYMLGRPFYQDVKHQVESLVQIATPVLGSSRAYHALKESAEWGDLCEWMRICRDDLDRNKGNRKRSFALLKDAMNRFDSVMELLPHDDDKILKDEDGERYPALPPGAWRGVAGTRLKSIHDMQAIV